MKPDDVKRYAVEVLHRFDPDEGDRLHRDRATATSTTSFRSAPGGTGRSVIVKQADKLLRSSGRPLDIYRNKIEAQTLQLESRLAPDYIPEVYHYDETMAALSMEDISAYKNLRKELLAGRVYGHLAENISTFLAQSLLPTTDLVLDRQEKKRRGAVLHQSGAVRHHGGPGADRALLELQGPQHHHRRQRGTSSGPSSMRTRPSTPRWASSATPL